MSKNMEVYLRTVEGVCIKLVRGFKWPSSESMGKRWIMKLCSQQQTREKKTTIGNKISAIQWSSVKTEARYQIVSGEERKDFNLSGVVSETIYIDSTLKTKDPELKKNCGVSRGTTYVPKQKSR